MDDIKQQIMTARPHLRPVTINNYMFTLHKLAQHIDGGTLDHFAFLIEVDDVMQYIETHALTSQATMLTAIIVALTSETPRTPEIDDLVKEYRNIFYEKKRDISKLARGNNKNEKEVAQWKTLKQLHKIRDNIYNEVLAKHIPDKQGLTQSNKRLLQKYLIASLYTYQPPRRNIYASTDLINIKDFRRLRKEDHDANYLVFSKGFKTLFFYFGHQKSKLIQEPKVDISPKLKRVLRLYLFFNHDQKHLIIDRDGKQMSRNSLTQQIKSIFGMGASMLRKIYISDKTKNYHKYIDKLAKKMGHSANTAKHSYLKN